VVRAVIVRIVALRSGILCARDFIPEVVVAEVTAMTMMRAVKT
jgi:hypothetical protein